MITSQSFTAIKSTNGHPTSEDARRLYSFDALRAGLTLLVLFHHTALTYRAGGGWFYHEKQPSDSIVSQCLTIFVSVNQTFFMGAFFLIAGYFSPAALRRKGSVGFLRDRLIRLGIPLLVFGFILGPLTVSIAQAAYGHNFLKELMSRWGRAAFCPGPLWFAEALLLFSLAAVVMNKLFFSEPRASESSECGGKPSYSSIFTVLLFVAGTGITSFLIRLFWPVGKEVMGMQLGYFASYIVLFVVGYRASDFRLLEFIPMSLSRSLEWISWFTLPLLFILSHGLIDFSGGSNGGWNVPSLIYAMWEPFVAVGIIVAMIQFSQCHLNEPSVFMRSLARRSYCIYIIHPVILVIISITLRGAMLNPLVKFMMAGTFTCIACYQVAGGLIRIPIIRRIV